MAISLLTLQCLKRLAFPVVYSICIISQAVAANDAARIVSLQGSGQSRPELSQQWRPASINQGLAVGDFVRTGDLSRMALLLVDLSQVSLHQNSQLQIKQVQGVAEAAKM